MAKIISWNINSVRARLDHLLELLKKEQPDIVALQEIKCQDPQFPYDPLEEAGYNLYVKGQKSYNGVAFLSKHPMEDMLYGLPNFDDEQARFITGNCTIKGQYCQIINGYMPNGNPIGTEKYHYKLNWMRSLIDYVRSLMDSRMPFILCGDFNIIPQDIDCYDPDKWQGDALFQEEVRHFYHHLIGMGLTDAIRFFQPESPSFTFWDYQGRAREKDHGIRIDHFLLSPEMMDLSQKASVLESYRDMPKTSDHAPICLEV